MGRDAIDSPAGIIAGRLRERYYRPTIVITDSAEGIKGSGRSIETYNMFEELMKCKELFTKFGGHPMAAGLSMEKGMAEVLRKRLNEQTTLTSEDLTEKVVIDVPMPIDYITEHLVEELSVLEPFGKANTKPVFAEKKLQDFKRQDPGTEPKRFKNAGEKCQRRCLRGPVLWGYPRISGVSGGRDSVPLKWKSCFREEKIGCPFL